MSKTATASPNGWSGSEEITSISKTITMETGGKYVDRDINMNISVPGMNLENNQTFYINDGLNTWNWTIDNNGNVLIT